MTTVKRTKFECCHWSNCGFKRRIVYSDREKKNKERQNWRQKVNFEFCVWSNCGSERGLFTQGLQGETPEPKWPPQNPQGSDSIYFDINKPMVINRKKYLLITWPIACLFCKKQNNFQRWICGEFPNYNSGRSVFPRLRKSWSEFQPLPLCGKRNRASTEQLVFA